MKCDLGLVGGGQLARMSIQAAQRMGLTCISLDPDPHSPASQVAESLCGSWKEPASLAQLAHRANRLALENEFVPADALRQALDDESRLLGGFGSLAAIQDKLKQRTAYALAGVPSPKAVALESWLHDRGGIELPVVLKARFGGYDGKGTRTARTDEELAASLTDLGTGEGWLVEECVPLARELAVMVFAGSHTGTFPTMVTEQLNHVCDLVFPCERDASEIALAAVRAVGGEGLFGVELFETPSGQLLVNEMAPRPHNSGHYTLDWGGTSQFEQHVRLALGMNPDPEPRGLPAAMANLLGVSGPFDLKRAAAAALELPGVHVHWYGKREMRSGRKMGHINAVGENCRERASAARERFFAEGCRA